MLEKLEKKAERKLEKKFPTYEQVQNVLKIVNAVTNTSEAHGLLSGLICVGVVSDITGDSWSKSIFTGITEKVLNKCDMQILSDLFEVTRKKIDELEFDFQLLLPSQDHSLQKRAQELGAWCQGFVMGLDLAGFSTISSSLSSNDCSLLIQRMTELASIDYAALDISIEDEASLSQAIEYVRFAVLMIHAELFWGPLIFGNKNGNKTLH